MYYIIPAANPAGAVPLAQPQYEEPQYQYGLEGNQVLYIAAGQDQAPLFAADGSLLHPQLLSAAPETSPLLFTPDEPGSGSVQGLDLDAWGEPGYLSAPAAFGGLAGEQHQHLGPQSMPAPLLDLGQQTTSSSAAGSTSNTAFLVQQLQQLQRRQQEQQQQDLQHRQQQQDLQHRQQQHARQQHVQQHIQKQQQQLLIQQNNVLTNEQHAALAAGQPWQEKTGTQVQRLLSSIAQNNNRRPDPFKMPAGRSSQPSSSQPFQQQLNQMGSRGGPMSAPTKPPGKLPHASLRAQPPSWAGSNWNPRSVGTSVASSGTGVFLPHLQQENKGGGGGGGAGSGVQPPAAVAESLTGSGPPSFASPLNSNVSGSAWSHALSSDPSVFVEDP